MMEELDLKLDEELDLRLDDKQPAASNPLYPERKLYISVPVPTSYLWHSETHFKHIQELKDQHYSVFMKWKNQGKIPFYILAGLTE